MANLRIILLMSIFVLTIGVMLTTLGSEPSTDEAAFFLRKVQEADKPVVIAQFGDNTCHCQPRGGFNAFLHFESGEDDNLAFIWGQKFLIGSMSQREIPTVEKFKGSNLPWEQPESTQVDVQIAFDKGTYSPYFLPLDMAYGHPVKIADLQSFCKDPSADFNRSLALRLRPSLEPGLLPVAVKDPNKKPEFTSDYYLSLLPAEQAIYVKPTDAADVLMSDGAKKAAANFADQLPRLKSATLRLEIVRRGRFQRWAVKKGSVRDPVFALADGKELALKTPALLLPKTEEKSSEDAEH